MTGNWTGSYKYDKQVIQKIVGFEKTNFTIEILAFDGMHFEGIVNDDAASGGMSGTGRIIGKIENDAIAFQKLMPESNTITDLKGTRKISNKKHLPLYYSGNFSKDKTHVSGHWKFKSRIGFIFWLVPIWYSPGKGTWEMSQKNSTLK